MIAVAGAVLLASLLGSPHCAGMCGGFVCFYAGQGGRGQALAHVAYNLGRLASYLLLGALAGLLGQTLDQAGAGAGLHRTAAVASGAVMVVYCRLSSAWRWEASWARTLAAATRRA